MVKGRPANFDTSSTPSNARVPPQLEIHLIVNNYATHKIAAVRRWFAQRPRYHLHFTPTSASWLDLVERRFVEPNPSCGR